MHLFLLVSTGLLLELQTFGHCDVLRCHELHYKINDQLISESKVYFTSNIQGQNNSHCQGKNLNNQLNLSLAIQTIIFMYLRPYVLQCMLDTF